MGEYLFALIGLLCLLKLVYNFLHFLWTYAFRPSRNIWKAYGGSETWAIVTGASDGIGYEYAKQLAESQFNIIMIARNKEKLKAKRASILSGISAEKKPKIQTLVIDYSKEYANEHYDELKTELADKEIAILVNNVGASNSCPFHALSYEKISEMIRVNIFSFVITTRLVLPCMLNRGKRCAVVGISSGVSQNYWPYKAIYGATKQFMNVAMGSLAAEYKGSNIDFMTCITGEVTTVLNPRKNVGSTSPERCVASQLKALGQDKETYGPWIHYLTCKISGLEWIRWKVAKNMCDNCEARWVKEKNKL